MLTPPGRLGPPVGVRETWPMSTADAPVPGPRRRRGTLLDMVRSLGIVAVAVLALVFFTSRSTPQRPVANADVAATVAAARANAPFPVLAASSLPAGWYANFASFDAVQGQSGRWQFHVGYTDGLNGFQGVDATNMTNATDMTPTAKNGIEDRHETVAGLDFTVYTMGTAGDEIWVSRGIGKDGIPYSVQLTGTPAKASGSAFSTATFAKLLSTAGAIAIGR